MSVSEIVQGARPTAKTVYVLLASMLLALAFQYPAFALETAQHVLVGMVHVAPLVIPGILLAAWIAASGANDRVAHIFQGKPWQAIIGATVVGASVPVCGVTVLPMMAGLLRAGIPLAPVMAFWLASPITGPALFAATAATLGLEFAAGKLLAAIGLGLFGGGLTAHFARRRWVLEPLRSNGLVGNIGKCCASSGGEKTSFDPFVWRDPVRRARLARESWAVTRLILLVLTPAFAAEYLLNAWLAPNALAGYVGHDSAFAVPLAVVVGGPAYVDGYAALPLTRALLENGMSPGAGMAFLVSGGVASIWGAMAIFPVLRLKPFLLYLGLAAVGSMMSGWAFGAFY